MKKMINIIFFLLIGFTSLENKISVSRKKINDKPIDLTNYLGYSYLWGGDSLNTGIDCSGFVKLIYEKEFNIEIPRTTKQMVKLDSTVGFKEKQNFDLFLFKGKNSNRVSHCALYFNNFIYQSTNRGTVRDSIGGLIWNTYYKKRLKMVKRVI